MPTRRAVVRWAIPLFAALGVGAALCGTGPTFAAHAPPTAGMVCIAPFGAHVPADPMVPGEASLSTGTWPPIATSVFEFRIDGKKVATVRRGEMAAVLDVAVDRKVKLSVKLDGKPFESYSIDLRDEPDQRTCLWLYPGYWRWLNGPWDEKRGCRCGAPTQER